METKTTKCLTQNDYDALLELVDRKVRECVENEQSSTIETERCEWRDLASFYIGLSRRLEGERDIRKKQKINPSILYEAFKNGCYAYRGIGRIYKVNMVRMDSDDLESIVLFRNSGGDYDGYIFPLEKYGETWALTKKELEEYRKLSEERIDKELGLKKNKNKNNGRKKNKITNKAIGG